MKRLVLVLCLLSAALLLAPPCFSGTTATDKPVEMANSFSMTGDVVTITATADAANASFEPILFDPSHNAAIYQRIFGRWLASVRTTPATFPAPTPDYDIYIIDGATSTSDHVLATPGLAIGTDTTAVASLAFPFIIDLAAYSRAAVPAGTEPGDDVIPQGKYGAVAFDIGADGTIDVIEAADNATGYNSAALAIVGVAPAATDHVRMGYLTVTKSDGSFTLGTTALNAANTTVSYISTVADYDIMGGRLVDSSATAIEEGVPAITAGDNIYYFVRKSLMVVIVGNLVNSAVTTLELIFN